MIYDDLDTIASNSFRNFHAKGLDYLCLHRSPELTIKAYFYTHGTCPEVVCPHDHRYPFSTHILAGESGHKRYRESTFEYGSPKFQRFAWRTPLLDGSGFTWSGDTYLDVFSHEEYRKGESYWCREDEIHTITIREADTVLILYQHGDVVPIDEPTFTWIAGDSKEPPSLTGLYDKMTLDYAEGRLAIVNSLIGKGN